VKVRVLSCEEREFAEAVDFYNAERPGLGYELAEEVKRTLDRISAFRGHGQYSPEEPGDASYDASHTECFTRSALIACWLLPCCT
jgi:hypothetical protein